MYNTSFSLHDTESIFKKLNSKMTLLFREIILRKDLYLLPIDLDNVEPLSDEKYKTIKF